MLMYNHKVGIDKFFDHVTYMSLQKSSISFERNKSYYVSTGEQEGVRHALAVLMKGLDASILDPNGMNSTHALQIAESITNNGKNIIDVGENLQTRATNKRLWRVGMSRGKKKGWCSIWTYFILYLDQHTVPHTILPCLESF